MSTTTLSSTVPRLPSNAGDTQLWVDRTRDGSAIGRNSRGAEVRLGPNTQAGVFTPGELLKIAIAACTAGSVSRAVAGRLPGGDGDVRIRIGGQSDAQLHRYQTLTEHIELDLRALDEAQRSALVDDILSLIDSRCPLVRTAREPVAVDIRVVPPAAD